MSKAADPYYSRKRVPDELVSGTGVPGLTSEQAIEARERKLSKGGKDGSDLRKFSNLFAPKNDPFYHRKPIPDHLVEGTGVPGLSKEQALDNRERKLSTAGKDGGDLRTFSHLWAPKNDPYYHRKPVPESIVNEQVDNIDPVEKYENRERKLSMFTLTNDPFDQVTGRRTSVVADSALGHGRRRSSAVAPDHMGSAAQAHSGYDGAQLEPIESRAEPKDAPLFNTKSFEEKPPNTISNETRPAGLGEAHHGMVHDVVTAGTASSEGTTVGGSEGSHQIAV